MSELTGLELHKGSVHGVGVATEVVLFPRRLDRCLAKRARHHRADVPGVVREECMRVGY